MGAPDYRRPAGAGGPQTRVLDFRVRGGGWVRPAAILRLSALVAAAPAAAGTVKGEVQLLDKGGRPATDVTDVVVYVDGAKARPAPVKVTMTMKGKNFIPRLVVVPVGGTVEFPNEDPIFHNVFSVSGENRFDLELYKRPKSGSWTFQYPGVVRVYCNIHPQMSAVVMVRDNPYYTKAAPDGSFAIEDVPAGKYVLRAWHERGGEAAQDIAVTARGRDGGQAHPRRLGLQAPPPQEQVRQGLLHGREVLTRLPEGTHGTDPEDPPLHERPRGRARGHEPRSTPRSRPTAWPTRPSTGPSARPAASGRPSRPTATTS